MTFLSAIKGNPADNNWGRETRYAACLSPLLEALGWRGNPEQVVEAMPHFKTTMDLVDLRSTLANLHFQSSARKTRLKDIDPRLLPCLFDGPGGTVMVVVSGDENGYRIFDSARQTYRTLDNRSELGQTGQAFFFRPVPRDKIGQWNSGKEWFQAVLGRFKVFFKRILIMTFLLNLLALATPLFIMAVYDLAINAGSFDTLSYLLAGVGLALLCDLFLRYVRARTLAHISARLDYIVGSTALQKILSLSVAQTERTTLGSKLARFREFDMIRDFFSGPMALAFLELPFIFIFLLAIWIIGGPLALVPAGMLVLYGVTAFLILPRIREYTTDDLASTASKGSFITECFNNMRTIKQLGAEEIWLDRYRDISAGQALSGMRNNMIAAGTQTFAHVIMIAAGVMTLTFGILQVLDNQMTVGALVACMALVWRLLAPIQTLFLALTRLNQIGISVKRLNQLFTLPSEHNPYASSMLKSFQGHIRFSRVSFRYSPDQDPAVMGLNFEIRPGEVVAFAGANSSGKSTVAKLLAGLYQPQIGRISIDDVDIRQIDPLDLRKAIGYMPQYTELFHGTIRQNLLLANSVASEEQIREVCDLANLTADIDQLPDKLDTRIGDQALRQLPAGFQQRLNMARTFLTDAKIMIFDEPGNTLDEEGDRAFLAAIEKMRGKATILMITHRPSHMRAADRVVLMNKGTIQTIGPGASVIPLIYKGA
ncbi:peptidase domain-containing ABC transporter [Sneathiella chinensis]|uniref:ABC transporter ATP-binding protein/permease n=1 Tax=Sneathiella chinensis TaxID=349750 RepID=A0ABQ5U581_9PROT|nr:ABC transporter transmembrane domain-containing protein [Sneathiella chinensis]GLQ06883.1 ABC transporter ATP-binding protein/permease [Sneathiella chinensis]